MGQGITKCMLVNELVHELKRCDGGLLVRFRDGDAVLPMVYVMQHDRAGHVDVGLPYPARERLAEIDAAARKTDGRPKKRGQKVWILIRRYEWESQAQQTEYCDTFVFTRRSSAIRKAASLLRSDVSIFGCGFTPSDIRTEEKAMLAAFRTKFPRHLVDLNDGDNVVYELSHREVRQ